MLLVGVVGEPDQSAFELLIALLLATYSAAAQAGASEATLGAVLVLGGGAAYEWATWVPGDGPADVAVPYLLLVGCWGLGRTVAGQVCDDGSAAADPVPGHGLIGMRERVSLHGGTLRHGPRPGGGFAVEATIPIEASR